MSNQLTFTLSGKIRVSRFNDGQEEPVEWVHLVAFQLDSLVFSHLITLQDSEIETDWGLVYNSYT